MVRHPAGHEYNVFLTAKMHKSKAKDPRVESLSSAQ